MKRIPVILLLLGLFAIQLNAQKITILHTNDMHSRLMGYGPESDYTPLTTQDDHTVGGFARIASLIGKFRNQSPGSLLVVDAGDFTMGTLFHTLEAETGFQLRLMKRMGYDLVALGNHEFDFGIGTLARILTKSAEQPIPGVLLSNLLFNPDQPEDDELENLFASGVVRRYRIIERNGLRIGFFSLMGEEAAMVAPYVKPASFTDRMAAAAELSQYLRESQKADLVICLSHCGVTFDPKKGWQGEDVEMAKKVPGIDLIISGHTHTSLAQPIIVNNIPIIQAGGEGRYVGHVEIEKTPSGMVLHSSELISVDDKIPGDPEIHQLILRQQALIGEKLFKPHGIDINKPLLETAYDLRFSEQTHLETSNLGTFLADALYGYLKKTSPADVVLVTAGLTRDEIMKGTSGLQMPADIFRIFPLGLGVADNAPGYSMARVYVTGRDLKTIFDAMLLASKMATGNYAFWSGVRYEYNSLRIPLDQVWTISVGNEADGYKPVDITKNPDKLYSIVTNAYVLEFFGLIEQVTKGILKVVPRFADGTPIPDLKMAVIDLDPNTPGTQEAKEWSALMLYCAGLPDLNGNGVPDIPDRYREIIHQGKRITSINPVKLFRATNGITVIPAVLEAGVLATAMLLIF